MAAYAEFISGDGQQLFDPAAALAEKKKKEAAKKAQSELNELSPTTTRRPLPLWWSRRRS